MKLTYVKLADSKQFKHPTSGVLKPIFTGDDLDMRYENGLITIRSKSTGKAFGVHASQVEPFEFVEDEKPAAMAAKVK